MTLLYDHSPKKKNVKEEGRHLLYNYSYIMRKVTVGIFYNRMFCFFSFLEIWSCDGTDVLFSSFSLTFWQVL